MTKVIALANQKGGVGKTTTAVSLGSYLSRGGASVLLIDLDPQANATSSVGLDKGAFQRSSYDLLIGAASLDEVAQPVEGIGLQIVPSSPALAGAQVELIEMPDRERRLKLALTSGLEGYDYALIDPPPSLGILTINALTAADQVIIPIQCEYLALEGLSQLIRTIDLVRVNLNPQLSIRGMLMTMYDSRTSIAQQTVEEVRKHFPRKLFGSIIPRSVRLAEAPSYGESISEYAPNSPGALAYRALAEEILRADGRGGALAP
jgi:chromosome partitioning protein